MAVAIVVLNDGETYTSINGCKIVILSDEEADAVDICGDPRGCNSILEIDLTSLVPVEERS